MAQRTIQRSFVGGEIAPRMFGRPDDVRFQHGAEQIQNYIVLPQGPAQKRPGLQFVREVKNSTNKTRLIPFNFSQDQTLMIEMGRDTVQSREIGYFRFHTGGSTVLYELPAETKVSQNISAATPATDIFTAAGTHAFETGDPIAFVPVTGAVGAATFAIGTPGVVTVGAHTLVNGQQIIFDELAGGGTLPPEVDNYSLYYVSNPGATTFRLSLSRFGDEIEFSAASAATIRWGANAHVEGFLDARRTYYVIDSGGTDFQIAATKDDAVAGTQLDVLVAVGNGSPLATIHYQRGDLVRRSTDGKVYELFRDLYADVRQLDGNEGVITEPTPSTQTNFWYELPGDWSTVTATASTDRINWTSHLQTEGTEVIFSNTGGALPAGLVAGTVYFIRNPTTNDFQVSLTVGGAVIDITTAGTGTHFALAGSIFEVPHFFELDELFEVVYAQSNDVLTLTHVNRPAFELRRLGATRWTMGDIRFNGSEPPVDVSVTPTVGFGFSVASVTAATPAVITTNRAHGMTALTSRFFIKGIGDVADGVYVASAVAASTITLAALGTHNDVGSGTTDVATDAVVQPDVFADEFTQTYVVTAINEGQEESGPSEEVSVTNHMLAEGAFNTIAWTQVISAQRYRIYKKEAGIGVFGFIGEILATQPLTFEDTDVQPDVSITAPILDLNLRRFNVITFDDTNNRIDLTAHGLPEDTPVILQGTAAMPTGLTAYRTYYVLNPSENSFELSETLEGNAVAFTGSGAALDRFEATAGLFPASVAYFEQRRVFGGSHTARQRVTMTASATESDLSFSIPTVDSDRISFDIAAREGGAIRHIIPVSHLMILSSSTEFRATPINSDALTPDSVSIRPQSFVGASQIQPAIVNNVGIFAADRGGHIREMGFSQEIRGFLTGDLSLRAVHLFDGLTVDQIAYAKAPYPTVWCVSSGGLLLGLTYIPEEGIGAWHRHQSGLGTFESVAAVAEGEEDHAYVIVKRNINSSDVRYVERMADIQLASRAAGVYLDSAVTYSGAATTTIVGLDHLEGETVAALHDGTVALNLTVTSGQVTIPTASSLVHVGLQYLAEIKTLPVALSMQAFGLDKLKNINAVWLRIEDGGQFQVGFDDQNLRMSRIPGVSELLNETQDIEIDGNWNPDGQIVIRSALPLPLTVTSVVYEIQPGG